MVMSFILWLSPGFPDLLLDLPLTTLTPLILAHRNRSDFCDLRLRCPSRTPEIAAISETRESNAVLRFKGAMESR